MKKILFYCIMLFAVFLSSADAQILTFDTDNTPDINLDGGIVWESEGEGHLVMNNSNMDSSINFNSSYSVESFNLNLGPRPAPGDIKNGSLKIAAFDINNVQVWNTTIDLAKYTSWSEWVTISVQTADIFKIIYYKTDIQDFSPKIDDLKIKETFPIPEPATLLLFGIGMIGCAGLGRRSLVKK